MNPNSAQIIHTLLVPAILTIASSILLFSTNSRYSAIVDRIRLLKSESEHLSGSMENPKKYRDKIELQISHLIHRIFIIRITIVSYSASLFLFTTSAILLGIRLTFEPNGYHWVILAFLFAGLLGIINGVVFSVIEIFKAYRIVHIEIDEMSSEK